MSTLSKLKEYAGMINIADEADISDEELLKIGNKVLLGYREDLSSSAEWMRDVKKVMELASLAAKKKNTPLPNSANAKYPLITKACYEFSSRTYPEIIKDGEIVKGRVLGKDIEGTKVQQAQRVADYINYQLLFESNEWELELDRLLNLIALIGFVCRKTYFDPVRKIIKSEICHYEDLVINSEIKSLEDARRISHVIHLRLNDLIENSRAGVFCKEVVDQVLNENETEELDPQIDVIEQHTFLDLIDDGYAQPYIVTVLKKDGRVLRIAPRFTDDAIEVENDEIKYIDQVQFFTDYHFLVNPLGKFQSVGFGILMLHVNSTINSLLNQLIDAGQLANLQGGYMDARLTLLGSDNTNHDPGEWKRIKAMAGATIKDGIMPINYKEPSSVLQELLGLLIDSSKDLSASSEVMTGSTNADNAKTGAVYALQQQGLKISTSIYRRVYRSLTAEVKKIYNLDSIYLDPEKYYLVLDDKKAVFQKDFDKKTIDIMPVADPNLSSEVKNGQKTQVLAALMQMPGFDPVKIAYRMAEYSNIEDLDQLKVDPNQPQQPNPDMIKMQMDAEDMAATHDLKQKELVLKQQQLQADMYKTQCECLKLKADAILALAQAESIPAQTELSKYLADLDALSMSLSAETRNKELDHDTQLQQEQMRHERESQIAQQQADQQAIEQPVEEQPIEGTINEEEGEQPQL